jgi:hypothetical protein
MKKIIKNMVYLPSVILMLFVMTEVSASGIAKLRDYDDAVRSNDIQKILMLRSYILGAVETHLLYSGILRDMIGADLFCTGNNDFNLNELGEILEVKIITLRRRYGEDIMDMPIVKAVQMIVEEQYKCY